TSVGTHQASATHTAHLAVNTLKRVGSTRLADGDASPSLSVMDPGGRYAYFATSGNAGCCANKLVKVDLATFQPVGTLAGVSMASLVIDPGGHFAYAGDNKVVHKIDLDTLQLVGSLALPTPPDRVFAFAAAGEVDPAGRYAYFALSGDYTSWGNPDNWHPARVVKVDLTTFQVAATLDMQFESEVWPGASVTDPAGAAAYFTFMGDGQAPARVAKIDLSTFQPAGSVLLSGPEEGEVESGVIDPTGDFAYFGTVFTSPGRIVKVDLRTLTRVSAITLAVEPSPPFGPYPTDRKEWDIHTAMMDPAGRFAYFATEGDTKGPPPWSAEPADLEIPARLIRIDLETFERAETLDLPVTTENQVYTGVIDPAGNYAYVGASQMDVPEYFGGPPRPGSVAKVALKRPPDPALAADADAYTTDFATPLTVPAPGVLEGDADTADGDPLVAGQASNPASGSVVLNDNGSFTYTPDAGFAGTDTFTYTASDGMDYSAPATVSVTVAPPEGLTGRAFGYHASNISLFGGPQPDTGP
ncbi:MAG TPA: cadherin-like domain-containing protein, partial [Acidimicrobiia bacterium]|nr:cadherin-like domain-containing protein [Acidimicrobiia bacterium]